MKDYIPLVVSCIAAVTSVGTAIFVWRLNKSDEKDRRIYERQDAERKELKDLYLRIHEAFEELIKNTKSHRKNSETSKVFSTLTSEVQLIASKDVVDQFSKVADLYHNWLPNYLEAYPPPKNGFSVIRGSIQQGPLDEANERSFEPFYKEYKVLVELTRSKFERIR